MDTRIEPAFARTVLIAALCCASPVQAQGSEPSASPTAVSPDTRAALGRMADALKALQSFELQSDTTSEEVLESGQKVQSSSVLTLAARRPDRLFINVDSERRKRQLFYDGRKVTIYGPTTSFYASFDAPPTTRQMLDQAAERYGVETPLADLFEWGAEGVRTEGVESSMYAGPDRIGGELCDHYTFRQAGTDWQIWIRKQGPALPCKMVIVDTEDPSQPQTTSVFTWTPSRQIAASRFTFTPPANAHRIQMRPAQAAATQGTGQ